MECTFDPLFALIQKSVSCPFLPARSGLSALPGEYFGKSWDHGRPLHCRGKCRCAGSHWCHCIALCCAGCAPWNGEAGAITSCLVEWQYGSLTHQQEYRRVVEKKPSSINTSSNRQTQNTQQRGCCWTCALTLMHGTSWAALPSLRLLGLAAWPWYLCREEKVLAVFCSQVCLKQMIIL